MKLLVTGGAGFIGSNFVRMSLQPDYKDIVSTITVLDSLTYAGNLENLNDVSNDKRFTFVRGDICDSSLVELLVGQVDVVINFAAESHVDRSINSPIEFVNTNVLGTMVLLEASKKAKVKRYIQISTDEVYGTLIEGSWTEDFPLLPNSPYAATKASADLLCRSYQQTYDLPIQITRCSNNYGPYQNPEKLIPLFITNLLEDKKVPVYGSGKNIREWIYVDDHCKGIWDVILRGKIGEIYNLSTEIETQNIEVTRSILEYLGFSEEKIEWVEDRLGHDFRYALSCEKAKREIGFRPITTFQGGLEKTIDWYINNRNWWQPLKID